MLTMLEEIRWEYLRDKFAYCVYLRAVFVSLAVDVGGSVYSRVEFILGDKFACSIYFMAAFLVGSRCGGRHLFKGGIHSRAVLSKYGIPYYI